MEKRLSGTCEEFCPSREVKLRRRERLVHKLESDKVVSRESREEREQLIIYHF